MVVRGPKYLVDERGKKKAVQLDIAEYKRLLQRLEELEDTLALDAAVKNASGFRDYVEIREELVREGRL